MTDFFKIKQQAEEYRKAQDYDAALPLYEKLYQDEQGKINKWIGWGYAQCLRSLHNPQAALEICRNTYMLDQNFDHVKNLYAWCIYDLEIKVAEVVDESEYIRAAEAIVGLTAPDTFSPYVKTVLKVLKYLDGRASYNEKQLLEWLNKLNPDTLSEQSSVFTDRDGKMRQQASEEEQYFQYRINALYEAKQYPKCIELCEDGLNKFSQLHYDNDIWWRRKMALAYAKLGDWDNVQACRFEELIARRPDWFLQKEYAEILLAMDRNDAALRYAVEAALNYGDVEKKGKLFLLLADIYERQSRTDLAGRHVALCGMIYQQHGWKLKRELQNYLDQFHVDLSGMGDVRDIYRELKKEWEAEQIRLNPVFTGTVRKILANGNAGFIENTEGCSYYFTFGDYNGDRKKLTVGQQVSFSVVNGYDRKKEKFTKNAIRVRPR